jgi:predicted RNA binding protein YcfA (HicA-like mRNA interferase family)
MRVKVNGRLPMQRLKVQAFLRNRTLHWQVDLLGPAGYTLWCFARLGTPMPLLRNSRVIIKRLKSEGWVLASTKGSHHNFKHPEKRFIVTVPHPKDDIARGTAVNIARLAGWRDSRGRRTD